MKFKDNGNRKRKQAGAELCQAQFKLKLAKIALQKVSLSAYMCHGEKKANSDQLS